MLPYLFIFFTPLAFWVISSRVDERLERALLSMVWWVFVIFVGLRHEVGADWDSYLIYFDNINQEAVPSLADLPFFLLSQDVGYVILNWISSCLDFGIYGVNFVCAGIFISGLIALCKKQALQWLALTVAIPIYVVMIAMGTVRQATALGVYFFALIALQERKILFFLLYLFLASLFHKSVLVFALLILVIGNTKWAVFIGIISLLAGIYLSEVVAIFWLVYVDNEMQSDGGLIRALMTAVPVVFMFFFQRRW